MGTAILLIAFVIEAAFVTYCIVTKSDQPKVRSIIRVGAFGAFVVFTLVAVIQWTFRWYALAALLLIWAGLGAWTLMRRQTEQKPYRAGPGLVRAVAMLLLVAVAVTPALIFPQYKLPPQTGQYAVTTVKYTYTDASRTETAAHGGASRKVNVEFWYPQGVNGKYPLVVFDHGWLGMKTSNTSTFIDLASNGYVVCSIDHPYQSLFTSGSDGRVVIGDAAFLQEIVDINNGKYDEATSFKLQQDALKLRVTDINFVLDTVIADARAAGTDTVYQLIDAGKIGLIGHSLGGAASAQVARERSDIGAVVNLDADLFGEYVDYASGKYVMNSTLYPAPILTILADELVRLLAAIPEANTTVAVQHVTATAPHAYEIHLAGTDHMSLTDLPLASPLLVSLISSSVPKAGGGETADKYSVIVKMNKLVLLFFNVYLKGQGRFSTAGTD